MLSLKIYSHILIFMIIMRSNSIENESPFTQVKSISIATKKTKDFNASSFRYPFLFHAAINKENEYIFHFIFYKTIKNIFKTKKKYAENYKEENVAELLKEIVDDVFSNSMIYKNKVKNRLHQGIESYLVNWAKNIKAFIKIRNQVNPSNVEKGANCDSQKDNGISSNNETGCFHNIFFACAPPDMIDFLKRNLDPDYNGIKKTYNEVFAYSPENTEELDYDKIMNTLISVYEKSSKNKNVYEVCLYLKTYIRCKISSNKNNNNKLKACTSDNFIKENELKETTQIEKKECFLRLRIHPKKVASWNVSSPDFIFNKKVNQDEILNIKFDDLAFNISNENTGDRCFMNFLEQISKFIMNPTHKKWKKTTPSEGNIGRKDDNEVKKILWFKYADKFSEEKFEFKSVYKKKWTFKSLKKFFWCKS